MFAATYDPNTWTDRGGMLLPPGPIVVTVDGVPFATVSDMSTYQQSTAHDIRALLDPAKYPAGQHVATWSINGQAFANVGFYGGTLDGTPPSNMNVTSNAQTQGNALVPKILVSPPPPAEIGTTLELTIVNLNPGDDVGYSLNGPNDATPIKLGDAGTDGTFSYTIVADAPPRAFTNYIYINNRFLTQFDYAITEPAPTTTTVAYQPGPTAASQTQPTPASQFIDQPAVMPPPAPGLFGLTQAETIGAGIALALLLARR